MTKDEAIKWVIETKSISAFTRNFVEWLYDKHGGFIANEEEAEKINGMTVMAHFRGMNPFNEEKK